MDDTDQQVLGITRPIISPIFKSGELNGNIIINLSQFNQLSISQEIGFIVGKRIEKPITEILDLRIAVKDVCPVIELCDFRFDGEYKAIDFIIDFGQFAKYFIGNKTPINTVDLDNIEVKLDLDGNLINKGNTSDVMGNQWYALLWLVNAVLAQGGIIEPGHILITGDIGQRCSRENWPI